MSARNIQTEIQQSLWPMSYQAGCDWRLSASGHRAQDKEGWQDEVGEDAQPDELEFATTF